MNPSVQLFISERRRCAASMKNTSGQGQTWSGFVNLIAGLIQVTTAPGVSHEAPRLYGAVADKRAPFFLNKHDR